MCLIIHAQPEYSISAELMADFAKRNDDGFGVMWIEDNKIHAKKFGPTEMDQLYPTYELLKDKEHFIHLRMRTHGDINADMAHPYYVGYGIWLMHNGVLPVNGVDQSKSDTWHFINDILNPLFKEVGNPHHFMRSKVFSNLMKQYLGSGNRIVMADRGGYVLFNRTAWHTIDNQNTGVAGMLVSNTYAWSASSYGRVYSQPVSHGTSFRSRQNSQPSRLNEDGSDPSMSASEEAKFCEQIKNVFFHIGRHWYVNPHGLVFRRRGRGFERRTDLDDNDQFWNTFEHDKIVAATVWSAGVRGVHIDADEFPEAVTTQPKDVTPKGQLAINWDNLPVNEEDETAVQTPTGTYRRNEAGVLVPENTLHSMHQNILH